MTLNLDTKDTERNVLSTSPLPSPDHRSTHPRSDRQHNSPLGMNLKQKETHLGSEEELQSTLFEIELNQQGDIITHMQ